MKKQLYTNIILLLLTTAMHAQSDALVAIEKIYNAYNSHRVIQFTGSMKMYAKNAPAKIIEKMQSSYTIKDKNFVCSLGPIQMLSNDSYYISVDNADKILMVGNKKDLVAAAKTPVLNIDQFKKQLAEKKMQAVCSTDKTGTGVLQLTDATGASGYSAYTIYYNASNGYMKKVLLETEEYNTENDKTLVLEINYTQPTAVESGKDFFSEKPFFTVLNKKLQLTATYKNYQIINQL